MVNQKNAHSMRAIVTQAIITSFSTAADKGLNFRGSTPELSDTEAVALMGIKGLSVRLLIEPLDYATDGKVEVKGELDRKSQSQRIRSVLFCQYKYFCETGKIKDKLFESHYADVTERWINEIKATLPPE